MKIQNSEPETIGYLEMQKSQDLHPKGLPPQTQLVKFGIAWPAMNHFIYLEVGKMWQWTEHEA